MTHPLFRQDIFIETAFARRFQAMLRSAWRDRSWHVIVADPGAGKTMSIRDLVKTAGSRAILAVVAPKNNEDEMALGNQFFTALGIPLRGRWCDRKPRLMVHLHQYGTECLVVDDAHDLSLEHLMFLKELTDQGRLQYDHPLGLCLVAAARGNTIPLKETLDQPDPTWLQWRRRLDKIQPFCRVASHTSEEVREILAALETVYRELFPQLNLRQWSGSIYTWLTQPVLDPANSGRVTMDYLMKLVTTALEWTYQAREPDVRAETLELAASLLVLRHDTLWIIDGAGPIVEAPAPEAGEQGDGNGAQREQKTAPTDVSPHPMETGALAGDSAPSANSAQCPFSRVEVPIDLQAFAESGTRVVECPNCGATRSLEPHRGVLRFKQHDRLKGKTSTPVTASRWARSETIWKVVGGERNQEGRTK
jgi:AAA domain-containing protein